MRKRLLHSETPAWVPSAVLFSIAAWLGASYAVNIFSDLKDFILVVLGSFLVAMAISPAVNWLERKGWRRGVATLFVMFSIGATFLTMLGLIGASVASEISDLADKAPETVRSLVDSLNAFVGTSIDATELNEKIFTEGGLADRARDAAIDGSIGTLGSFAKVLPGFLLTYYLAAEFPKLLNWVLTLTKPANQSEVRRAFSLAVEKTGNYVAYRVVLTIIGSIYMGTLFFSAKVPFAIAATLWFAMTNMWIPVVGSTISIALPTLLATTVSPQRAIVVLLIAMFYQNLVKSLFLGPKLKAKAVKIHPAFGFSCVIVGLVLFGPAAALMATPIAAALQAFISPYVTRHDVAEEVEESEETS